MDSGSAERIVVKLPSLQDGSRRESHPACTTRPLTLTLAASGPECCFYVMEVELSPCPSREVRAILHPPLLLCQKESIEDINADVSFQTGINQYGLAT
jgi:hypothetical protein